MERFKTYFKDKTHLTYLAVFLLVLLLNCLATPTSDDLGYSVNSGLLDIFQREYIQYMTWTGRSVAHIIARCFLALPKGIFDIANSICFIALIHLMARNALGKNDIQPKHILFITTLIFLFVPVFGQTVLWEPGSCNYLWTTTIILAFLKQYRFPEDHKPIFTIAMFFFGIIAGWTNENTGGACILMVLFFFLLSFCKKEKRNTWMYTGLMGAILGFLILIKAPGNSIRAEDFVHTEGLAYELIHDLDNTLDVYAKNPGQLALWIFFAAGLGLNLYQKKSIAIPVCFAFSSAAAVAAIMLSPVPVLFDRSMFGATIFLIIAIAALILPLQKELKMLYPITLSVFLLYTVFNYGYALIDLGYTRYQYNNREAYVSSQKAQENLNPVIPTINNEFFTTYNPMYGLNDILSDSTFVNNENYAITHGLESVTSTTLDKWSLLYKEGNSTLMNIQDLDTYLNTISGGDYLVVINSSTLDDTYKEDIDLLNSYGYVVSDTANICMIAWDNKYLVNDSYSLEETIDGHYIYISTNDDETLSDILIDNVEYTNDNAGINIVIYDRTNAKVIDSATFNAQGKVNRSYSES